MDRKQLLLVDDDPSAIHVLAHMLGGRGDLRFATSGDDALRLAQVQQPDPIVLVPDMPGLNGFDVCRALQADAALAEVPVIVATSRADVSAEVAALELGVVHYPTKPLLPAQVLARVQAAPQRQPAATAVTAPPPKLPPTPSLALQAQRVLIVDDEPSAVLALRKALVPTGAQLYFAHHVALVRRPEPAALALRCDRQRLQQCLLDLIGNAVKFSPRGGRVQVDIGLQQGCVHIAVRDQGPGLSPQQQAALSEPFNRLGQTAATPGVGLGLLITRALVQAMQGVLRVHSVPGQGSCLTLVLPCQPPGAVG